ncbi:RNase P modulator RnpM [Butyrivibrio sp. MC2013]|uniref:RNase P modulator RnpM n=1 Tax=Butyrivibrio sp. MC2013 TaxID=1280686 RepID=UPI0004252AA6|nr:YlxR family protein [Butyrivibrio sp. MC2013]
MIKKIPMRQCIGCGEMKPKKELLRIIRTPEGTIEADITGKASGRGAYICPDPACLQKATKNHGFQRAFKMSPSDDLIASLEKELKER